MDLIPLSLKDFSGGFTDNYLNGQPNKFETYDNLIVTPNQKPKSRPGSVIWDLANYQIPPGAARVGTLIPHDSSTLLAHSGKSIFSVEGGSWSSLTGPGGSHAFNAAGLSSVISWSQWKGKGQTYVTDDSADASTISYVHKIFRDSTGTLQIRTAGLPKPDGSQWNTAEATVLSNAIALANDLRTKMLAHFADVTAYSGEPQGTHRTADTASAALVEAAATNEASLVSLTSSLIKAYHQHHFDINRASTYHYRDVPNETWLTSGGLTGGGAIQSLSRGPSIADPADQELASTTPPETLSECVSRLNDLKTKYNTHEGNVDAHGSMGLNSNRHVCTASFVYDVAQGPGIFLDRQAIYDVMNLIKTRYNIHRVTLGTLEPYAHAAADTTNTLTTANATTPETLEALIWNFVNEYSDHNGDANVGSPSWHVATATVGNVLENPWYTGPNSIPFPDLWGGIRAGNWSRTVSRINHLRETYNGHVMNTKSHRHGGTQTVNPYFVAGQPIVLANYRYAFVYAYEYTVGEETFLDLSAPLEVEALDVLSTSYQPLTISNLPVLANTAQTHYDTASVKLQIYRTTDNGNQFYKVGEVDNGTTTFKDRVTDEELLELEPLYTTGGVVENDPPPQCRTLHLVDDLAYYGGVIEGGAYLANRVRVSVAGDPDSCPERFFTDINDTAVNALSSFKSRVIALGPNKPFRLDGSFNELGQGALTYEAISEETGGTDCPRSVVQTEVGVFYFGPDGVYHTDAFQVQNISQDWPETYQRLISSDTKKGRVQGAYDPFNRRVYWTVQASDASAENDKILCLDLRFGVRPDSTFTTWSNDDNFRPTAICVWNGSLYRGDSRGYIFKHGDAYAADPKINTSTNPSTWAKKAIVYNLTTSAQTFGHAKVRKFIPSMEILARNHGNLSLQINSYNDDQATGKALKPVRFRSQYTGVIREERNFPAGGLRCSYKQIELTNANVIITNSDTLGNASVNKVAHTVTLDSAVSQDWPADAVDWKIFFEKKNTGSGNVADGYATGYTVTARTDDTLTFSDPGGTAPSGSVKWVLKGIPKDEVFELLEISVNGSLMIGGSLLQAYQSSQSGANA